MPTYFIDADDQDLSVVDSEGMELPDDDAARRVAIEALPEMLTIKLASADQRIFTAAVRDQHGHLIYEAVLTLQSRWHKKTAILVDFRPAK